MKVTLLGTGTSSGVPVPGCTCRVCSSGKAKNQRLRTSILIELERRDLPSSNIDSKEVVARVLVDTSPDLRYQSLRAKISSVDAVLYTHVHADHVFGIDDLRSFNFVNGREIPIYASEKTCSELETRFSYAFFPDPNYEGGAPPKLKLHRINSYEKFELFGVPFLPLLVEHGATEVFAYRVGNFAYATDCVSIPKASRENLLNLDALILDGLRIRPHNTHFTIERAAKEVEFLRPKKAYLTHISHEVDHDEGNDLLRALSRQDVELAYDGLVIEL